MERQGLGQASALACSGSAAPELPRWDAQRVKGYEGSVGEQWIEKSEMKQGLSQSKPLTPPG